METNPQWYAAYRTQWCASFNAQQKNSNSNNSVPSSNYLNQHSQFNSGLHALNAQQNLNQAQANQAAAQMQQSHHNNNLFNFPLTPPKDVTPDTVSNAVAAALSAAAVHNANNINNNNNNNNTNSSVNNNSNKLLL